MRDIWLTVESCSCARCGVDIGLNNKSKYCPNPDCGVEFATGKMPVVVIPWMRQGWLL